jgi:SAM-dependent methyltransferase
MPLNYLHSRLHRVEDGWDPISSAYAEEYASFAWSERHPALVERLDQQVGGLVGKRVLDLGGGPGQYSILFAQHGAEVTWHDVSRQYESIARRRAEAAGVKVAFSMGYLEAAARFDQQPFDLVFCRVCWYYARSDRAFAKLLYSVVKPGGLGYVECNTPAFAKPTGKRKVQYWLNQRLWWKVGHPLPPRGRIARLLQQYPLKRMELDYSSELTDIVVFVRPESQLPGHTGVRIA